MGLWRKFVEWLFTPTDKSGARGSDEPRDVDENAIAKELNLEQEAQRLGAAGQPAPDSTLPLGIEAQIVQRVDKARLDFVAWASTRLSILNADLAKVDVTAVTQNARQTGQEFSRRADALLSERAPLLKSLSSTARNAEEELNAFRAANGLTRDAQFPEGAGRFLRFSALAAFIVIEAVLNANLFAVGLEGGLIAGFVYAATFAFLNVIAAFLLGRYVIRQMFHRSALNRLAGIAGLLFSMLVMLTISLVIAHFRDALVSDVSNPSKSALASLVHATFAIDDINSWLLLGLSLLFGIGALVDGLSLDDRYPGYGRLARRYAQAESDYQDEVSSLREDLESIKDEMLERLESDTRSAQALLVRHESLLEQKEKTRLRFKGSLFNAQRCMEALVTRFRTENKLHRKGLPLPPSFSVMPVLEQLQQPDFRIAEGTAALAEQRACVKELMGQVQEVKAAIQSGFTQKFNSLVALDEQLYVAPRASETLVGAAA
ncbi:hypothetical protein AWB81_05845 [Caballeronia arationis]|uniref:hypothetical protein n=1 Tax=Caballeronia arationis TaxID=1777142 RepID=UPI00074C1C73|nr:hypothetical protein [Caballeronia arationis]SAL00130.1 hypothetical protein AWB81_05845 [Caballeronia arationis]